MAPPIIVCSRWLGLFLQLQCYCMVGSNAKILQQIVSQLTTSSLRCKVFVQNYIAGIMDISQVSRQLWKLFVLSWFIQEMIKEMLVIAQLLPKKLFQLTLKARMCSGHSMPRKGTKNGNSYRIRVREFLEADVQYRVQCICVME